ncbi:MAG: PorV/PorQ family protein [candidate division FCPU426 bacterium]
MRTCGQLLALLVLAGLAAVPAQLLAGDRPASRNAMSFLLLGAGPRAMAMGEAFTGLGDDVTTLSWNSAGLAGISEPEIFFMHNQWISNLKQEFLAGAVPLWGGCAAAQAAYLNSDVQLRRDDDGLITGEGFNPFSLTAGLAFGLPVGRDFSAGASLNYAREQLDDVTYQSGFADLGALFRPAGAWWSLGAAVQNLGLPVAGYSLPLTLRVGAAGRFFSDQLNFTADVARTLPGWFRYGVGAEYWYRNMIALRAGYLVRPEFEGLDRLSGLRAGLGFNIQGYQLDYALTPQGDLGLGHRVSFTYFFGGGRALASEKESLLSQARQQGQAALAAGRYAEAVNAFQKVLAFLPNDASAGQGLEEAQRRQREQEKSRELSERFARADRYAQTGQLEDALDEYQRILLTDAGNTRAAQALDKTRKLYHAQAVAEQLAIGRAAFKRQQWVDALQAWQAVLALDEKNAEALAQLDKTREQLAKGGKEYKDPRIQEYYAKGLRAFERGDYRGAIDQWSQVLEIASGHKQARQYLKEAIRLRDLKLKQLIAAGDRYVQADDLVRAVRSWRQTGSLVPKDDEAQARLQQYRVQMEGKAKEFYLKGIEVYTLGQYRQAIAYWKDVLILQPDYPGAEKNIQKAQEKIKATQ